MTSSSNDYGRALEYKLLKEIVNFLDSKKIEIKLTQRTKEDNLRDEPYLNSLSSNQKLDFQKCSQIFMDWTIKEKWFNGIQSVIIDRLPDSEGIRGDVTDIRFILFDGKNEVVKNLSVKNHHNDLKHPRLPNFPKQCGITDNKVLKEYNSKHDKIWLDFFNLARKKVSESVAFNQLKSKDSTFIDKNLYRPLNNLIINNVLKTLNPEKVKKLFIFLTGNVAFYTLKNEDKKVIIKNFSDIALPTKIKISYLGNSDSTLLLRFNNNWDITMRLHNSSTDFYRNNQIKTEVKYAVACINIERVIKTEEIFK